MKSFFVLTLTLLAATPFFAHAEEAVWLTNIPALTEGLASTPNIPAFINGLYRICIGVAVVIAVLQLIRGGITWSLSDSVTEKSEAKKYIGTAVGGLVLVLSPYLVYSIINPEILNLNITPITVQLDALPAPQNNPQTPIEGGGEEIVSGTYMRLAVFGLEEQSQNYSCPDPMNKSVFGCIAATNHECAYYAACKTNSIIFTKVTINNTDTYNDETTDTLEGDKSKIDTYKDECMRMREAMDSHDMPSGLIQTPIEMIQREVSCPAGVIPENKPTNVDYKCHSYLLRC